MTENEKRKENEVKRCAKMLYRAWCLETNESALSLTAYYVCSHLLTPKEMGDIERETFGFILKELPGVDFSDLTFTPEDYRFLKGEVEE